MTTRRFGLLELDDPDARAGQPAGDPALVLIACFLRDVINASAERAWREVHPTTEPVAKAFTHNPADTTFNEKDLPAIFLFRSDGQAEEDLATDYNLTTDSLKLQWVFPALPQEKRRIQSSFINAVNKNVTAAIWEGRHPAWRVAGDADPLASSEGSFLQTFAGFFFLRSGPWRMQPVVIEMADLSKAKSYLCCERTLSLGERLVRTPSPTPAVMNGTVSLVDTPSLDVVHFRSPT